MAKASELIYVVLKSDESWYWRLETQAKRVVATGVHMCATREACIAEIELVKGSWNAPVREQ
ncbi:MAG: hypothetical protein ACREJO_09985 [Phycisphaerales bacterium]